MWGSGQTRSIFGQQDAQFFSKQFFNALEEKCEVPKPRDIHQMARAHFNWLIMASFMISNKTNAKTDTATFSIWYCPAHARPQHSEEDVGVGAKQRAVSGEPNILGVRDWIVAYRGVFFEEEKIVDNSIKDGVSMGRRMDD